MFLSTLKALLSLKKSFQSLNFSSVLLNHSKSRKWTRDAYNSPCWITALCVILNKHLFLPGRDGCSLHAPWTRYFLIQVATQNITQCEIRYRCDPSMQSCYLHQTVQELRNTPGQGGSESVVEQVRTPLKVTHTYATACVSKRHRRYVCCFESGP